METNLTIPAWSSSDSLNRINIEDQLIKTYNEALLKAGTDFFVRTHHSIRSAEGRMGIFAEPGPEASLAGLFLAPMVRMSYSYNIPLNIEENQDASRIYSWYTDHLLLSYLDAYGAYLHKRSAALLSSAGFDLPSSEDYNNLIKAALHEKFPLLNADPKTNTTNPYLTKIVRLNTEPNLTERAQALDELFFLYKAEWERVKDEKEKQQLSEAIIALMDLSRNLEIELKKQPEQHNESTPMIDDLSPGEVSMGPTLTTETTKKPWFIPQLEGIEPTPMLLGPGPDAAFFTVFERAFWFVSMAQFIVDWQGHAAVQKELFEKGETRLPLFDSQNAFLHALEVSARYFATPSMSEDYLIQQFARKDHRKAEQTLLLLGIASNPIALEPPIIFKSLDEKQNRKTRQLQNQSPFDFLPLQSDVSFNTLGVVPSSYMPNSIYSRFQNRYLSISQGLTADANDIYSANPLLLFNALLTGEGSEVLSFNACFFPDPGRKENPLNLDGPCLSLTDTYKLFGTTRDPRQELLKAIVALATEA